MAFIDRLPSWSFLLLLLGIGVVMWLLTLVNHELFWTNFIDKYIWTPIVQDEGYNVINTIVLMVVLGCILGWAYRLMAELGETVDLELTVGVVPYLVWGSIFRVLEDSDLFGPFNEDTVRFGGRAGSSCWPQIGGSFLHHCFGVFFITPIIYVIVTFIAVFFLWIGHRARRVGRALGPKAGLRFVAFSFVGLLSLYFALWAGPQTFIRVVANPLVPTTACLVAFWLVWRDTAKRGEVNPHWVMFAYGLVFFIVGAYYVFVWMNGGIDGWRPRGQVSWWVLVTLLVAPFLVALSTRLKGRRLSGGFPDIPDRLRRVKKPDKHVALLIALVIIDGGALFLSMLAVHAFEDRVHSHALLSSGGAFLGILGLFLVGPAVLVVTTAVTGRIAAGPFGVHPALVFFANPVNLLMVFGQSADALMTSLGIDVFGYSEKHVAPGFLITRVAEANLPAPFGDYPATLVMIPLKILIVLLVVWLIDASAGDDTPGRRNLIGLVKLAIIMVGLSPGVRDGVRLAMAT